MTANLLGALMRRLEESVEHAYRLEEPSLICSSALIPFFLKITTVGYVHVLWSANEFGSGIYDFKVLPWPKAKPAPSKNWPGDVQRFWTQAKNSLKNENWDAAAMMARSALQFALRDKGARPAKLHIGIEELASKGILHPLMKDWAQEVRELGNESAHPEPSASPTHPKDARDILQFLDFLLLYLYDMPKHISDYRQRRKPENPTQIP